MKTLTMLVLMSAQAAFATPAVYEIDPVHTYPSFEADRGADASAKLDGAAFGISAGKDYGFSMDVTLRIQVEALRKE